MRFLSRIGNTNILTGRGPSTLGLFCESAKEIAHEMFEMKYRLKKTGDFQVDQFLSTIQKKIVSLPCSQEDFNTLKQIMIGKDIKVSRCLDR